MDDHSVTNFSKPESIKPSLTAPESARNSLRLTVNSPMPSMGKNRASISRLSISAQKTSQITQFDMDIRKEPDEPVTKVLILEFRNCFRFCDEHDFQDSGVIGKVREK